MCCAVTLSHLGKKKRKGATVPPGKRIWNQQIFEQRLLKRRVGEHGIEAVLKSEV